MQLDFINRRLSHDVKLKLPFFTVLFKNMILFSILALLIGMIIVIRPILIDRTVWFGLSIFGYIVCTSGFIYSELHNMPMFRFDKDQYGSMGISEYFMRSQRSQYAGEGYITSLIAFFTSMCFLLFLKSDQFLQVTGNTRRVVLLVAMLLGYSGIGLYVQCYKIKSPWYNTQFQPPHDYLRGPLSRD